MTANNSEVGTLYFFCGRAGAGKSTLAAQMSVKRRAILICEDQWLVRLYDGAPNFAAYIERRGRIRLLLTDCVPQMLASGHSVIFDFGGNTIRDRAWVRSIFETVNAAHELHYIIAEESLCRRRIRERNRARPEGVYWGDVSDEQFEVVNSHLDPPMPEEMFTVVEHMATN